MKETTKSSTTTMVGDFDEEHPSGHHVHIHNHYHIHHNHYHNQNEAKGGEDKEPKEQQHCLKESLPVNDTPSNGVEEETPPAETLPINPTPSASLDLVQSPANKPYVRIQSANKHEYFLSVRDGKVIFASFDPFDESQHWYKEANIGTTTVTPFFYLVNKSTGEAIKYSDQDKDILMCKQVQLITYNPQVLDKSTLWTLSFGYNSHTLDVATYGDYMLLTPFSNSLANLASGCIGDGDPVKIGGYDYRNMWRVIHCCDSV